MYVCVYGTMILVIIQAPTVLGLHKAGTARLSDAFGADSRLARLLSREVQMMQQRPEAREPKPPFIKGHTFNHIWDP